MTPVAAPCLRLPPLRFTSLPTRFRLRCTGLLRFPDIPDISRACSSRPASGFPRHDLRTCRRPHWLPCCFRVSPARLPNRVPPNPHELGPEVRWPANARAVRDRRIHQKGRLLCLRLASEPHPPPPSVPSRQLRSRDDVGLPPAICRNPGTSPSRSKSDVNITFVAFASSERS